MDILTAIQDSAFSSWVRESTSVWAYPFIIFVHSVGLSIVVGGSVVIDLAVLGFAPGLPLSPLQKLYRIMGAGFWLNVASGIVLTMADASTMVFNPIFWIKMIVIAFATADVLVLKKKLFGDPLLDQRPLSAGVRALAVLSLILWAGAITAGRLTAYLGAADPGVAGL